MDRHLTYLVLLLLPALVATDYVISDQQHLTKRSADNAASPGIKIYSLRIDCKVTSRFAHNVITSRVANRANVSKEVTFDVDLPKTAFISNFSMIIDGVTYTGIVKEKQAAQKQYQQAVSRGQSAGLVKASGRKTEKFKVAVNVAAASKITFELVYEELLKRHLGKYEMLIKVRPNQLVDQFQIEAHIYEPQGISFLDAEGTFVTNELLPIVEKSFSGTKGHISFKPTVDQQRSCPDCGTTRLDGDFLIKYDVNRELSAGDIQIVNGYFVHFFSPTNLPRVPMNAIFIIDKSGSMWGHKIQQTKTALLKILEDLTEDDYFNYVLFSSDTTKWKESLVKATPENVEEAKKFIATIDASGGTNMLPPLMEGLAMQDNMTHDEHNIPGRRFSTLVLLTDGQAYESVDLIRSEVRRVSKGKHTLYCLGFGNNVDYNFLEHMALENKGLARRIYEDSDADLQLQGFFSEVANPILQDITLGYSSNAVHDLTQTHFDHYFDGFEIVVAGKIDNNLDTLTAEVTAQGAKNDIYLKGQTKVGESEDTLKQQQYIFGEFTERLWAYLTIQQLLEKRNKAVGEEKANITAQALELSLKYNFVTPLTSMVVTKPEEKEDEALLADKPGEEQVSAARYNPVSSRIYSPPPAPFYSVDGDPHFIIEVPKQNDTICFNIDEKPGVILNLVNDPLTGVTVNGQIIGNKRTISGTKTQNTFFGKFGIVNKKLEMTIEVTPQQIVIVNGKERVEFSWQETVSLKKGSLTLSIKKEKNLLVAMEDGATFVFVLHRVWKNHPLHQDYLGLYILNSHLFSEKTHGLLGQFYYNLDFEVSNIHPSSEPEKPDATMIVKGNKLTVTRGWQKDYRTDPKHGINIPCWFVHNNGKGLIDGVHTDYIVSTLLDTV